MLTYKDGRLCYRNFSFAIPDGCKLHSAPDVIPTHGVVLMSPEEDYQVVAAFEYGEGGAQESLESVMKQGYPEKRIKERAFPGGSAWCGIYKGERYSYFDARFDISTGEFLPNGEEVNIFHVEVTAPHNADLRAIRRAPLVSSILESFKT